MFLQSLLLLKPRIADLVFLSIANNLKNTIALNTMKVVGSDSSFISPSYFFVTRFSIPHPSEAKFYSILKVYSKIFLWGPKFPTRLIQNLSNPRVFTSEISPSPEVINSYPFESKSLLTLSGLHLPSLSGTIPDRSFSLTAFRPGQFDYCRTRYGNALEAMNMVSPVTKNL